MSDYLQQNGGRLAARDYATIEFVGSDGRAKRWYDGGMKAIFLDRDATVSVGIPKYERVDSLQKAELLPNTLEAMRLLATLDFGIFFVTNQAGLAEGLITTVEFNAINNKVLELVAPSGISVTKTYVCPHGTDNTCECRKPKPKMLLEAAREFDIELAASYMVGDRVSDIQTGINAGTMTILVQTGAPGVVAPDANYTATDLLDAARYIANH